MVNWSGNTNHGGHRKRPRAELEPGRVHLHTEPVPTHGGNIVPGFPQEKRGFGRIFGFEDNHGPGGETVVATEETSAGPGDDLLDLPGLVHRGLTLLPPVPFVIEPILHGLSRLCVGVFSHLLRSGRKGSRGICLLLLVTQVIFLLDQRCPVLFLKLRHLCRYTATDIVAQPQLRLGHYRSGDGIGCLRRHGECLLEGQQRLSRSILGDVSHRNLQ
mmetsp:Transcript_114324/g.262347  ORF Transcript_114324/g.262347 Transcript_114324/m.262347 type:complete len:216 (-) Transcript_114324:67-714(-)